jgi:hypothetical protein
LQRIKRRKEDLIAVAREVTNVEFMRGTLRSIVAA